MSCPRQVPNWAAAVVTVDPATGAMTGHSLWPAGFNAAGTGKFFGGVLGADGAVWLIPRNADRIVRFDPPSGGITGYDKSAAGVTGGLFSGGTLAVDGSVWMAPVSAAGPVRVATAGGGANVTLSANLVMSRHYNKY